MYHFWGTVIKPLFDILQPRAIVEIGADFGHNTRNILEYCRQTDSRAHIVDPVPKFEPEVLKNEYGDVFEFYKSQFGGNQSIQNVELYATPIFSCEAKIVRTSPDGTIVQTLSNTETLSNTRSNQIELLLEDDNYLDYELAETFMYDIYEWNGLEFVNKGRISKQKSELLQKHEKISPI